MMKEAGSVPVFRWKESTSTMWGTLIMPNLYSFPFTRPSDNNWPPYLMGPTE